MKFPSIASFAILCVGSALAQKSNGTNGTNGTNVTKYQILPTWATDVCATPELGKPKKCADSNHTFIRIPSPLLKPGSTTECLDPSCDNTIVYASLFKGVKVPAATTSFQNASIVSNRTNKDPLGEGVGFIFKINNVSNIKNDLFALWANPNGQTAGTASLAGDIRLELLYDKCPVYDPTCFPQCNPYIPIDQNFWKASTQKSFNLTTAENGISPKCGKKGQKLTSILITTMLPSIDGNGTGPPGLFGFKFADDTDLSNLNALK